MHVVDSKYTMHCLTACQSFDRLLACTHIRMRTHNYSRPFETDLGLSSQRGVPACHTRNVLQTRRAPGQIQKDGRSIQTQTYDTYTHHTHIPTYLQPTCACTHSSTHIHTYMLPHVTRSQVYTVSVSADAGTARGPGKGIRVKVSYRRSASLPTPELLHAESTSI